MAGRQLSAKFDSSCPECGSRWKKDESIFYEKEIKNSKGKSFACTDKACFSEHGGTIGVFKPTIKRGLGSFPGPFPDKFMTENSELDITLSAQDIEPNVKRAADKLNEVLLLADSMAEDMYQKLPKNTQTFGQIRSKLADQIIALYNKQ